MLESFLTKFMSQIFKCKSISSIGAEQLLLDTQALRSVLIQITLLGTDTGTQVSVLYSKLVGKGIIKIEQLLKTIMTPIDPLEIFVEHFIMIYNKEATIATLQRLLELKVHH